MVQGADRTTRMDVERQKGRAEQLSLLGGGEAAVRPLDGGEAGSRSAPVEERQASAVSEGNRALETDALMERICEPENLNRAYKRVKTGHRRVALVGAARGSTG